MDLTELQSLIHRSEYDYQLNAEFAYVEDIEKYQIHNVEDGQDKPGLATGEVIVRLESRPGQYSKVQTIAGSNPPPKTRGVVLFVGTHRIPVFIPFVNSASSNSITETSTNTPPPKPGEKIEQSYYVSPNQTTITVGDDYPMEPFINFEDYLRSNPELLGSVVVRSGAEGSPTKQHFGTPATIKSIVKIAIEFLNVTGVKLKVGDIGVQSGGKFDKHEGEGHATGRGVDLYSTDDILNSVYNIKQYGIEKALNIVRTFYNGGARFVIWDVSNAGLTDTFVKTFGRDKFHPNLGNHATHWHVSFLKGRG